ncbi:MAG: ferrous iron transport protein B, partial [Bacilli bacterium]
MLKFALAGNPNSGKTTLFNSLTGSTAHVGNWPGVTVDKKEGLYKKLKEQISIIDLPGIYSLSPYTPEEVISRNFILEEKPDCIINIVDATNLERNLYLSTQLLEIDVPIVIALNMMDAVTKSGDSIDAKKLQEKIGVPVVEISALKEENIDQLMKVAFEAAKLGRKGATVLEKSSLTHLINDVEIAFKAAKIANPLFHAIKLIEKDEIECEKHNDLLSIVDDFKSHFNDEIFGNDLEAVIADARYKYISSNFTSVLSKKTTKDKNKMENATKSDKIDRVLTNKWAGIPIFIAILFVIFHLTFSEDLFYLNALGILGNNGLVSFSGSMWEGLFANGGINSPGVILFNLLDIITSNITELVTGLLESSPLWVSGFIGDGILGGLFAVLSFLPQILVLFLFFSILEDSGYMARVAFILDRIFRRFGLSGRAFMPMIMGFGCSIPAMINTRTLADENEKIATIRVIPFFSCGAKLPILTAIAGGIVTMFGIGNADIITLSMYLLGMVTAIVTIIIMRNTTMKGEVPPFI